jgi:phosphate transport system substrate-binding protein
MCIILSKSKFLFIFISSCFQLFSSPLPRYEEIDGLSGTLSSIGSDSMLHAMEKWTDNFKKIYGTDVKFEIEALGSSTAPKALIEGRSNIGPMSRPMKETELQSFIEKFGYKPARIGVAIDAMGVFVHAQNPISGMTLQQLDSVFSSTYLLGGSPVKLWGDILMENKLSKIPISKYGRNSNSGTHGVFKSAVLAKGEFSDDYEALPDSESVISSVEKDKGGIGYSGLGYLTSGVKALKLGKIRGKYYEPNLRNAMSGRYPLGRVMFIYFNKRPGKPLEPLTREFLKYILSREGQKVVADDGSFALDGRLIALYRKLLF